MMRLIPLLFLFAVAIARGDTPSDPTIASPPSPVPAQMSAAPTAESVRLRTEIRAVVDSEEFHERKTLTTPVPRDWFRDIVRHWFSPSRKKPERMPALDFNLLARLFEYAAIIMFVAAAAWLLWKGRQWLLSRPFRRKDVPAYRPAPDSQVTAINASALPPRVSAAARAAWAAGDVTMALSLLYRGAVRELDNHHGITLPDSSTEGECLRQAQRSSAPVIREAFSPIVKAWMAQAYADCPPDDFPALVALYEAHFETTGGVPR